MNIVNGPAETSIIVRDATKTADEAWINSFAAQGETLVTFVTQLASPLAPTVCTHWQAGVQLTPAQLTSITAGADGRLMSVFPTARWRGISEEGAPVPIGDMTYEIVTNPYTHVQAAGLVYKEESFD